MACAHAGAAVAIEDDPRERRHDAEPSQAPCSHVGVTITARPRGPRRPGRPGPRCRRARAVAWSACADGSCSGSPPSSVRRDRARRRSTRRAGVGAHDLAVPGRPTTAAGSSRSRRRSRDHGARRRPRREVRAHEPHARPRSPCWATRASRTSASARAACSRTCTRRRPTSTGRVRAATVPVGIDTSPDRDARVEEDLERHTARWHDHRIHWMGAQPPPPVAAVAGHVPSTSRNRTSCSCATASASRIAVALDWVPGPSGLPWIPVIAVLFALGVLGGGVPQLVARARGARRRDRRLRRRARDRVRDPAPGYEPGQGRPVPRRQLRVDRGVDRGRADDRRACCAGASRRCTASCSSG